MVKTKCTIHLKQLLSPVAVKSVQLRQRFVAPLSIPSDGLVRTTLLTRDAPENFMGSCFTNM